MPDAPMPDAPIAPFMTQVCIECCACSCDSEPFEAPFDHASEKPEVRFWAVNREALRLGWKVVTDRRDGEKKYMCPKCVRYDRPPLIDFVKGAPCPKCLRPEPTIKYVLGSVRQSGEQLEYFCKCGYRWTTKTAK